MDYIFQTTPGQKHMLYSMGDQVVLRRVSSDFISRPVNLTRDYSASLTGVVHNNIIYYAYITKDGTIDVRHVGSNSHIFRVIGDKAHLLYNPVLTSLNKHLILFFCQENSGEHTWSTGYIILDDEMTTPDTSTTYNVDCPSSEDITSDIDDAGSNMPSNVVHYNHILTAVAYRPVLSVINIDSHLLINVRVKEYSKNHIFDLSPDLSLTSYDEINAASKEQSRFQMKRIDELQSNIETLQQAGSNMMNKISSLLQENDALRKKCSSLHEENSNTKKALTIREAQIESAKKQYNELMNVAERYRDEAAKWRMKLTAR